MVALGAAACGDDVTVSEQPAPTPVVRAVVVSPSAATIGLPGSFTFGAAVDADAGLATTVTWSSSNAGVATVVNGVATAVSAGTASICATSTVDANKSSCAQLTVVAPPPAAITSVEVTPMSASIPTGGTFTFVANVQATGNAARTVTWSSSNTNIATVNAGVVTAGSTPGSVAICAASTVDANFRTCVALTVVGSTATVRSVNVTPSSAALLLGESVTLGASVDADAGVARTVTWSSTNPSIATVTSGGVVTASSTNAGVTAVCAASTVDNNITSCAQITVSAPPAPEPAQIAIQTITVGGNLAAPVNVNNVAGQIDVTVIVTPNDQSVQAVDILVDDQVASTQTFTAQDAEALSGNLTGDARTVTLSFDTRALNASNQPRYGNGPRVIRARIRVAAGQGATGADALQTLTFNNIDRLLIQTAPVGDSNTADDVNGLRWTRTQGGYGGTVIYVSYSGRAPSTITVKPFCNSVFTTTLNASGLSVSWSRNPAQMAGYVTADSSCNIALGELPTVTGMTMTDGNPAPADIMTDAATSAENMPARRRLDNAAPANLDAVNVNRVAPAANGWINATYSLATATPLTSSTDAGVGFVSANRRTWYYFGCGQGTSASPIQFDGTGANIPECESDRTNNAVYTIFYIERDALGNETTLMGGARGLVGVDKTAPTARWSSTSNPNLAIRNTAGTLIPEFRDIGSGLLNTSAVTGHQVLGSRAQQATTRPNSLGCYRLDGSAPGAGQPAAPSGTDPFGTAASGCNSFLLASGLSALGAPDSDGWRRGENLAAGILNQIIRIHVTASDRAGNQAVALTRSILVDNTTPDAATVTSIPTSFTTTQPVVTVEYQDNVKVTGGALHLAYADGTTLRYPFSELSSAFGVPLNAINLSQQMTPNYPGPFIVALSPNFSAPVSRVTGVRASIFDAQSNNMLSAIDPVPTQYVTLPTGAVTATSFAVVSTLSSGAVSATMNTGSVNGTNPFAAVHFYRRLADGSWQYVGQATSASVSDVSIFDQTKILTWSLAAADRSRGESSTALVSAVANGDVVLAIGVRSNGAGHHTTATTIGMPNALSSLTSSITSTNVRGPSVTYNTSNTSGGTTSSNILPTYFSGLSRTNITNGMTLTITRGNVVRNNIGGVPSTNTVTYNCVSSNTLRATVAVSGSDCVVTGGQESGDVTITWSATAAAVAGTTANTVSATTSLVNTGAVAVALELFGNSTWIAGGSGSNLFQDRNVFAPGASVSIIGQVVRPGNISAGGYGAGVTICQTDRPDLVTVTPATTTIAAVNYPTCNIVSNAPITSNTDVNVALRVNLPAENGLSAVMFEQSRKITLQPSSQATSMNTSNGPLALARPSGTPTTSSVVGSVVRSLVSGQTPSAITATCASTNSAVVSVPGTATIAGDVATCNVTLGSTHGSATVTITVTAPAYTVGQTTVAAQTFTETRTFTVLESQVLVPSTVLAQNQLAPAFTPVGHLSGAASRTFAVSPALPAGLTMNASTGQITGTPTVASAATTYTVTITDAGGAVAQTRTFSLAVSGVLTAVSNGPRIFNASGAAITPFTPVTASGGTAPYQYALTGEFPGTLALNTSTGVVSGVVNAPFGTTTYTVVVTDALGEQAQATFTLTVNPTLAVAPGTLLIQMTQGQTLPATTVATITGGSPTVTATQITAYLGLNRSYNAGTGLYQISGTATGNNGGVSAPFTATFTDAIGASVSQAYNVQVWAPIATTVVTPNVTLTAGVAYTGTTVQPVTATGGRAGLVFTVSPALPAGVVMNADGSITGTPSVAVPGQTYTATVTDANGATATANFELAVAGSPPNAPVAPTAAASSSTSATVNWVAPAQGGAPISAYEVQWALASAPTTWIGTQSTGNVLTTAVTGLTAGQSYVFRVAASNAFGQSAFSGASAAVALPLPPTIAPNQTPFAWTAGLAITGYTPALGSNGQAPATYSLIGAPGFLTIDPATGAVTGTPTAGVYNFDVVYTDDLGQTATQAVVLNVNAALSLSPATQTLELTIGQPYTLDPLTPAGGTGVPPYTWSVSPALTGGLSLNTATGQITASPVVGPAIQPVTAYTVTITDALGATAEATLNIVTGNAPAAPAAPVIAPLSSTTAGVTWVAPSSPDAPISTYNIEYQDLDNAPGVWVAVPNVNHPTVTTTITGLLPSTEYNVRVRANSAFGPSAWSPLSINFTTPAPLVAQFNNIIILTQGVAIAAPQDFPVTGTGGQLPYTYSVSPALPAGLSLNATTGQITGTPTTPQGATNYTMTVSDGIEPNDTEDFTITINAALATSLDISNSVLTQNVAYVGLQPVSASGGTAPITWSVMPGLPAGLSMDPATGIISGTPTVQQIGTDYTITATDFFGATSSKVHNIAVIPPQVPDQVTGFVVTDGGVAGFNFDASWTAPANNGSPISGYFIEIYNGSGCGGAVQDTVTLGVVTSVNNEPHTTGAGLRSFRIRAVNGVGSGTWSTCVDATMI